MLLNHVGSKLHWYYEEVFSYGLELWYYYSIMVLLSGYYYYSVLVFNHLLIIPSLKPEASEAYSSSCVS